ncbi:metallophosphoesterase family protein [Paenibacillus sediminis]|uniref:Protein phosphatase n=1 Tax=Paenibacillus sediminis TaxID=664909 RepID=A0ABS4H1U5_9BACL|nr:metallophosphoesterase family protein [Paenibacillus sediminis]MBP1936504.1 protein phosphatase [Paenibacillus sediminis]
MDRIAIISDIHGNIPALQSVLADIESRDIKSIYCLGDLVGKGPHSEQAVDITRERCEVIVRGNWDEGIGEPTDYTTIQWHQQRLGKERLDYLKMLPFSHDFYMSGRFIRLVHASPQSVHYRVQPWDPIEKRLAMFENTEAVGSKSGKQPDVVGYGDIHNAYLQHIHGKVLFNVGSVGNPLDVTQASYVILEGVLDSASIRPFSIQFMRVAYDIEFAIRQAMDEGMPDLEPYIKELRTGRYRGLPD